MCVIQLAGCAQVWDVTAEACQHTLRHHSGKVQAVAWNPAEAPVLLSGGFDQAVALVRPCCHALATLQCSGDWPWPWPHAPTHQPGILTPHHGCRWNALAALPCWRALWDLSLEGSLGIIERRRTCASRAGRS